MNSLVLLFVILGSLTFLGVIALAASRSRQRRLELQTEVQTKLIERFGSTPELITFLQSPAGRDFVAGVQHMPYVLTRQRIIGGFWRSIMLTAIGAAFLLLTLTESGFIVPGVILFSLGLGYLIATFVSMKLSKSMEEQRLEPTQLATVEQTPQNNL